MQRSRPGLSPPRTVRKMPLAGPAATVDPLLVKPRDNQRRRRNAQITRGIADATGRSEVEVQLLVASTVVSVLVAGGVSASLGVMRFLDFVRNA